MNLTYNTHVSIPFIAGQWSLPLLKRLRHILENGLNPLHCGAVVASLRAFRGDVVWYVSQSPSLRGSGRFGRTTGSIRVRRGVSIPFIAGQWSLQLFSA